MPPKRKSARISNVAAASSTTTDEPDTIDYAKMTVAQLKAECTNSGLDATGKKADLVKRLEDNSGNGPPAKMVKQSTLEKALEVIKTTASNEKSACKARKPDKGIHFSCEVHLDYDCMLNQTNIGHNNNKYYVIQVVKQGGNYYAFNRWGRVGESGATSLKGPFNDAKKAIADFEKKFQDKTRNKWSDRAKFKPSPGKYTLLDMSETGDSDDEEQAVMKLGDSCAPQNSTTKPSTLDKPTENLMNLIFSTDMFQQALKNMDIDVKKMPLGKLSKTQIVKGFEVLDEIDKILKKERTGNLTELSNKFYTVIPHDFGRQRPTVINSFELLRKKMDMLITLGDIELAQGMLKKSDEEKKEKPVEATVPHPTDINYNMLDCDLTVVKSSDEEFKIIQKYLDSTKGGRVTKLLNVWRVGRKTEGDRFSKYDKMGNRKLLWHGTNVAVVAAILKSGLRIMPHSGGRVGRGIYFASENDKSAGYVGTAGNKGIMFLNEVVLGKENTITMDNPSLKSAPKGFDSVVARGHTEPDPKFDTTIDIEGKEVVVPQGKAVHQPQYLNSSFSQTEYLVYDEAQVRIRYLLEMNFTY